MEGYEHVRISSLSISELANDAISQCLARGADTDTVDTIIFVTESFDLTSGIGDSSPPKARTVRNALLDAASILVPNACVYGTWMAGCGNLSSALMLASALVTTGSANTVMIVLLDLIPTGRTRLSGTTVFSDVAATCLISRSGNWRIEHIIQGMPAALMATKSQGPLAQGRMFLQCVSQLLDQVAEKTGYSPEDFTQVILDNLGNLLVEEMAKSINVSPIHLRTTSKRSVAHSFSADCLLSLAAVDGSVNQRVLLVNTSSWCLGAVVLERSFLLDKLSTSG
jgi:3-oxoacyl-[acyl-carrier-protein] synthase III